MTNSNLSRRGLLLGAAGAGAGLALPGCSGPSGSGGKAASTSPAAPPNTSPPAPPVRQQDPAGYLPATARLAPGAQQVLAPSFPEFWNALSQFGALTGLRPKQAEVLMTVWAIAESGIQSIPASDDQAFGVFQFGARAIAMGEFVDFGVTTIEDAMNPTTATRAAALYYADRRAEPGCETHIDSIQEAARSGAPDIYLNRYLGLKSRGLVVGADIGIDCNTSVRV